MSVLGPEPVSALRDRNTPIVYPTRRPVRREPYERVHRTSTEAPLDLDAEFRDLNRKHFGASLPKYRLEYVDKCPGGDGRFTGDAIEIEAGQDRATTRAIVLHEMVHAYELDGPELTLDLADPHGPTFQKVARMIDPSGGPRTQREAEGWTPRDATGTVVAPNVTRSAAVGKVQGARNGRIGNYNRKPGDQVVEVVKGRAYPADHWAVVQSPKFFTKATS